MAFDDIFSMFNQQPGGSLPGMGGVLANQPELLASTAAANGVPPPPLPPLSPAEGGMGSYPDVGASLAPSSPQPMAPGSVPLPQPRPAAAGPGGSSLPPDPAAAAPKPPGNALLDTLRGVKAPAVPESVKPGATAPLPHQPSGSVKGGQLQALLAALQMGGGGQPHGLTLPSTLGAALGGR